MFAPNQHVGRLPGCAIVLTGGTSSGKSTVGHLLEHNDWFLFDTGPFLREFTRSFSSHPKVEQVLTRVANRLGNPRWGDEFVCAVSLVAYEEAALQRQAKGLILSGFRSYESVLLAQRLLGTQMEGGASVWFVSCPEDTAWQRYHQRERSTSCRLEFQSRREQEKLLGLGKIEASANVVVDNSGDMNDLRRAISKLIAGESGFLGE